MPSVLLIQTTKHREGNAMSKYQSLPTYMLLNQITSQFKDPTLTKRYTHANISF
uniref:Protein CHLORORESPIRATORY REDUCTION 6ic n=1 Tax=Rhizophora mucronata TaxID=61149 RepID=A0A2P2M426_RHIMU